MLTLLFYASLSEQLSFLNGLLLKERDHLIITGRTFDAVNLPPYMLPEHKTKTVWRSRTHQGSGFNGFFQGTCFEDQVGNEQVFIRAQHDKQTKVLNDETINVGNDQRIKVENDAFSHIKKNQHFTVNGECRLKIYKDKTSVSEATYQRKVTQISRLEARQEIHLKSGVKAVIEADQAITLKAGGNYITIDANGVHLMSPNVTLNEGGAAAEGTPFTSKIAERPLGAEAPEITATEATNSTNSVPTSASSSAPTPISAGSAQTPTLVTAAEEGLPICEECLAAAKTG